VSERPMTEGPNPSRLRKPVGRLRDLPIWSKLGLIMIVPTIATIVVGTAGLIENISAANAADRTRGLSRLSSDAASVIHELQNERAVGTVFTGSAGDPKATAQEAYKQQIPRSDQALNAYKQSRRAVSESSAEATDTLREADRLLDGLPKLREDVLAGAALATTQTSVALRYELIVDQLVNVRESAVRLTADPDLSASQQAALALSDRKAALNEERVIVLRMIASQANPEGSGLVTYQVRRDFNRAIAQQEAAVTRFFAIASPEQRQLLDQSLAGSGQRKAALYESQVTNLATTGEGTLDITAPDWDAAIAAKADLLRQVEKTLDEQVVSTATAVRDDLRRTVLLQTGLLLSMLLLAILFAWLVARSMARSLRELRHGALTVAQYGLPQAVARLRDPSLAIQATPDQVAKQIAEPLPVRSRDEFGQVTEAFNAVHLEAVRTAAEQAQLRASVATMFVNLARRSQILVDRLIGHLDRLERGEEDPDRLAELFQLDHLATRMRRNDENLLVLAGADSSRVQREPAPLMDVLRAAQSEVEHYTRIEFGMIDRDVEIAAHSVNDMVHLVAELLDNATAFSPPDSAVVVEARRVGDRAVLLVEDRGIGISPDQLRELNDKLANPPAVDVAVSRMMGLVVVARLAARHGVRVELRAARERGTVADITLPASVLVSRLGAARATGELPVVGAGADRQLAPAPRAGVGAPPLALESSGPGAPRERAGAAPAAFGPAALANQSASFGLPTGGNGVPPMRTPGGPTPQSTAFGSGPGVLNKPPSGPISTNIEVPPLPGGGPIGPGGPMGPGGPGGFGGPGGPVGPGVPGVAGSPGLPPARPGAPGMAGAPGIPGATPAAFAGSQPTAFDPGNQPPSSFRRPAGAINGPSGPGGPAGPGGPMGPGGSGPMGPGGRGGPGGQAGGPGPAMPMGPGGPAGPAGPPSRALPPWSDLTGATGVTPANGNGAGGPGPSGPARPDQPGNPPLPQRRAGDHWTVEGEVADGTIPRQRPSGPDAPPVAQSGAQAAGFMPPPAAPRSPSGPMPAGPGEALPTRPASGGSLPSRPTGAGQPLPAQPAQPAEPPAWPPATAEPAVAQSGPAGPPSPSAPPAEGGGFSPALDMTEEIPRVRDDWAPPAPAPAGSGQPAVNGNENGAVVPRPDETMELPIFRAVESAWFRTRRPSPMRSPVNGAGVNGGNGAGSEPVHESTDDTMSVSAPPAASVSAPPAASVSAPPVTSAPPVQSGGTRPVSTPPMSAPPMSAPPMSAPPAGAPTGMPVGSPWSPPPSAPPASPRIPAPASAHLPPPGSVGQPAEHVSVGADRATPAESVTWRTAADDGWRAAEALADDRDFSMTETGLPKRVPMSQLVPGGVEKGQTSSHRRTPEAVRGLLSAYHRGVQRGRSQSPSSDSRTPQSTQAGPRNPQGGKEREA